MQDYEKLGVFYLGQTEAQPPSQDPELLLFDSRELTTHAVILGMTGSGKTGLATALIEESAIDGIPAILIDPKGDLGNLMLQFPELTPEQFLPWIDAGEAQRKQQTPQQLAQNTATKWREGLAAWRQDASRIKLLQDSAEFAIYTPGNTAGRPLQVLRSFDAPGAALIQDQTALRERVLAVVSGLLGLLGRDADPVQSRDHILLSTIIEGAWRAGRSLDLAAMIMEIQKPPFTTVGVFDIETFYPARDRMGLAMSLNNILASPGFAAWTQGEPLDIQRLLYTANGKPRVSILYLAHLSDAERMFFITVLLNEILAWMRQQSGTSSLRALLYMDEIFGYFPPGANPPSKLPMLTLLKQARAFGLGVVLSTQNPVDLDYKGLANCGTWFIGRMQTARDVDRVIAGLESTDAGSGANLSRSELERLLAGLGNRRFLLRNVNEEQPILFETRWVMSYLSGPMTLPQVATFSPPAPPAPTPLVPAAPTPSAPATPLAPETPPALAAHAPHLPPEITCRYLSPSQPLRAPIYEPRILGAVKLHFVDARSNLDIWQSHTFVAPFNADASGPNWSAAVRHDESPAFDQAPTTTATFIALPAAALNPRNYTLWFTTLKNMINQEVVIEQWSHPGTKLYSTPGEGEGDFKVRVSNKLRELRDAEVDKLRARYATRFQTLGDQIRRAHERVDREKSQAGQQKLGTMLSFGTALASAFLGRGIKSVGNVGRVATAARSAGRVGQKQSDIARAQENLEVLEARQEELTQKFDQEVEAIQIKTDPTVIEVEQRLLRPRKTEIILDGSLALCWTPLA